MQTCLFDSIQTNELRSLQSFLFVFFFVITRRMFICFFFYKLIKLSTCAIGNAFYTAVDIHVIYVQFGEAVESSISVCA